MLSVTAWVEKSSGTRGQGILSVPVRMEEYSGDQELRNTTGHSKQQLTALV